MASRKLTPQQELFAYKYLEDNNATRAALRAGYAARSASSQGSTLLKHPKIRQIINAARRKVAESTEMTIERVVLELSRILLADPVSAFDDDGCLLPLRQIPEDIRRAMSSLEVEEVHEERETDEGETETVKAGRLLKVKFWSKTDSAQQLLRKLGAFRDGTDRIADALEDLIAAKVPKADDE